MKDDCGDRKCDFYDEGSTFNCVSLLMNFKKCKGWLRTRTDPVADVLCNVGLDLRKAIRRDAIFLLEVTDSDCHLPDVISCLQTTRASLKLKVDKLIELRK